MSWLAWAVAFYNTQQKKVVPSVSDKFYLEADANVNLKLLPDNYIVVPYLQAGIGAAKERNNYFAYAPLGVGLQFNLFNQVFVHVNSNYRVAVTSKANYSLLHSFGVSVPIKARKVAPLPPPPAPTPEPPKDKDGDGVLDADDACPDVLGLAALRGCPDTDNDGVADKDDKCVNIPGVVRYDGCPVPDSDNDNVNDEEDKCPTVAGLVANAGCPAVEVEAKPVAKPVVYETRNVYFAVNSYSLTNKSKLILNEVASILKEKAALQLNVDGYTDNTGNVAYNKSLSENRVAAVKAYLIAKGIEAGRLISQGFGQDSPAADNATNAGKAQNRRVELKLNNK